MTLSAGTRLGRYEIRAKIGEGGMGEVYLAHDTALGRNLALKILPADVAVHRERMERFVREAKAAASLNHPHIAHIYEIGEVDGTHFIAMEFIDGVTLRQKIYRQKAPLSELLKYLTHAAEGLAKAHAAGIVHRDLKPDNIMITNDGYAKILDFGLAKLIEGQRAAGFSDSSSEITTKVMPQHSLPGTVLGTVGYMSPEQTQGRVKDIDHRSDVFSFGCILFEAATAQKAFDGKDALDSLHKIVHAPTPQIKDFVENAPDDLQRIIRRCLAKEPDKRFQSIKDVAIELEEIRSDLKDSAATHLSTPPVSAATSGIEVTHLDQRPFSAVNTSAAPTHSISSAEYIVSQIGRHKQGVLFVLTAVAVGLIGGGYLLYRFTARTKAVPAAGSMKIERLVNNINVNSASISPDGKYVVYVLTKDGNSSLRYRQVSSGGEVELAALGQDANVNGTTFSPDTESVYYQLRSREYPRGALFNVPVIPGRPPRKILEYLNSPVSFGPDGKRFVFRRGDPKKSDEGIYIGNLDGGEPRLIAKRTGQDFFQGWPAWSPDGKVIVTPVGTETGGTQYSLVEIPAAGGPEHAFTKFKWRGPIYKPLWFKDGTGLIISGYESPTSTIQIFQVTYPEGNVTQITKDLNEYGTSSFGLTADSSTIVTIEKESTSQIWLADAGEEENHTRKVTDGKNDGRGGLAVLSDGRFVYWVLNGENRDVWIMNADGSGQRQLFSNPEGKSSFSVTPDGHYLLYVSARVGQSAHIFRLNIDTGEEKQITFGGSSDDFPFSSADSQTVYFGSWRSDNYRFWKTSIDGGEATQVTDLPFNPHRVLPGGKLVDGGLFDEQVTPARWRGAFYSLPENRIVKIFDYPKEATEGNALDEHTLIYTKPEAGVDNIWTQPIDGGPAKQLTRFISQQIGGFASNDYKHFAVMRGTSSSDLVLIKNFR